MTHEQAWHQIIDALSHLDLKIADQDTGKMYLSAETEFYKLNGQLVPAIRAMRIGVGATAEEAKYHQP